MQMAIFMRGTGKVIKLMELVLTDMQMEQLTMESGKKINNMEKVLKTGLMEQNMMDNIETEKSMIEVCFHLRMEVFMKVIFKVTRYLAMENMYGQMENHLMAVGKEIK